MSALLLFSFSKPRVMLVILFSEQIGDIFLVVILRPFLGSSSYVWGSCGIEVQRWSWALVALSSIAEGWPRLTPGCRALGWRWKGGCAAAVQRCGSSQQLTDLPLFIQLLENVFIFVIDDSIEENF